MADRRRFIKLAGGSAVGLTTLAGCIGGGGSEGGEATDTTTDSGGGSGEGTSGSGGSDNSDINVGMVYALGGLGDNSFNDMAHQGIRNAQQEFGISFQNAEPSGPSDFRTLQRRYATQTNPAFDLVCVIGFNQANALTQNAPQFGDQKFMIVDAVVDEPNVASYTFKEHQGSFQVGHLAGLLTTRDFKAGAGQTNDQKVVGFVGGKENTLIKKFQAGYQAGVNHAGSDIEVKSAYVGSWSDPAAGKEIALSMYNSGADVIYHAAGGSGTGVFRAAQQKGRFAIGVDSAQSESLPKYADVIVASMVKHVDTAVFNSVKHVVNGNFKGGNTVTLGLAENGVEASYGTKLGDEIPQEVKSKMQESRKAIMNGEISVPTKP